jgi:single-strand DNA-binding protein
MSASPITIIGNVTALPELKFLDNGSPKVTFSVAVSHYWTDAAGEKQEKTSFFDVVAWRYLAEDVARVLDKGVRVIVTGRLEQRSWDDKDTGAKRSKVEILADEVAVAAKSIENMERRRGPGGSGNAQVEQKTQRPRSAVKASVSQSFAEDDEPF